VSKTNPKPSDYRGRLAPSPTGFLHLGHARTFWIAQQRVRERGGCLILRNDDLDRQRCKPEFVDAMFADLKWFGFEWDEGSDVGGVCAPYDQSARMDLYRDALESLKSKGFIYPCNCSRKDIAAATQAPHAVDDEEPIYPGTCREKQDHQSQVQCRSGVQCEGSAHRDSVYSARVSWRFRVPDGEKISFGDNQLGSQSFVAGRDFGDFVIWRHDDVPSYQLTCVVDDASMRITEVVRGEDLLMSTARQLLLYRALALKPPEFFHCPLVLDESGVRLAKRHDALSLRKLRESGANPEMLRSGWC